MATLMSRLLRIRRMKCWSMIAFSRKPSPSASSMFSASMVRKSPVYSGYLYSLPVIILLLMTAAPALVPAITAPRW